VHADLLRPYPVEMSAEAFPQVVVAAVGDAAAVAVAQRTNAPGQTETNQARLIASRLAGPPGTAEPDKWSEPPIWSPQAASDHEPDGQAARLDELLAQVGEAAQRVAADNAGRQARAEYAVRVEREAQAEPEPSLQAEAPDEAEIEL
jgi:hypothetical protein